MVVVVVGENHILHGGEVNAQLFCVLQNSVRTVARIHEHAMAVGLDEGGESPLADALVGEHGRKNGDFKGVHLGVGFCGWILRLGE